MKLYKTVRYLKNSHTFYCFRAAKSKHLAPASREAAVHLLEIAQGVLDNEESVTSGDGSSESDEDERDPICVTELSSLEECKAHDKKVLRV